MQHKHTILILVLLLTSLLLPALELDVKNEIPAYQNLTVKLTPGPSEGTVKEARFFFYQTGKREPLYSEFNEERGIWVANIPYTYLIDEELVYFAVMQNTDGTVFRTPQIGEQKARLVHDTTPPKLKLVSPKSADLVLGKEQVVIFEVIDESALTNFSITLDGQEATRSGVFNQYLSFIVTPEGKEESIAVISMTDRYENTSTEEIRFTVKAEKAPMFMASGDYRTNVELEYILGLGKSANTSDITTVLNDQDHQLNLTFELGGDAYLKAGPVGLEVLGTLKDTVSVFDITEAYPNTLQADLQNILNLYNPIDFANEFDYTGEEPRKFDNDNQFLVKVSFFGPALTYQFGDQKTTFQKETIKDLGFRGTSIGLDLGFLELKVGKGLTDLGLYQVAWPQNFFGFQFAIKVKKAWYLQTNLSFISALQGRYTDLKQSGATSDIGTLYDLSGILPDQNMVFGLSTGHANKYFSVDASFSLSLYNENAGTIVDVNQLATDLENQGGPDLGTYVGYLDKIHSVFPILDYFLPSNGLVSGIVDKDLWGISYGVEAKVPKLGIQAWIRKTDATYKSLGSSLATDEFTFGSTVEQRYGDFSFRGGYSFKMDNIADILFNDIIALVKPDLAPTSTPTAADISQIVHTAQAGVDTPQHAFLGTLGFDYTFAYETTNAEALAKDAADAATETAIKTSTDNDTTLSHTGELRWRSARYKIGSVTTNFGAKTKDSYVTKHTVDGTADGTTFWELGYALSGSVNFSRYTLSLGFDQTWSTEPSSLTSFGYDAKFGIKETFFDTISFTASFDQAFRASLEAYKITGSFALEKRLGLITVSTNLDVSFYDSLLDDSDDAITSTLTVKGVFSK